MKIRVVSVLLALIVLSSSLTLSGCEKKSFEDDPSSVSLESYAADSVAEVPSEEELTLDIGDDTNVFFLVGDVDDSFDVNSQDALMILREAVGLALFDKNARILADIDKDSSVTSSDALEVLRYSVGMSDNDAIGNPYVSNSNIKVYLDSDEVSVPDDFDGHILTFDSNGGSNVRTQFVYNGSVTTIPIKPQKDGFVFDGWYMSQSDLDPFSFGQELNEDTTLYARWADKNFMLRANSEIVAVPPTEEGVVIRLTLATMEDAPDGIEVKYGQKDSFDKTVVLFDNASEINGDDIRGDGIYSGYVTLHETDTFFYFAAELGSLRSNTVRVQTTIGLEEGEEEPVFIVNGALSNYSKTEEYKEMSEEERKDALLNIVLSYYDEGLVTNYSVDESMKIIVYRVYTNGVGNFYYGKRSLWDGTVIYNSKETSLHSSGISAVTDEKMRQNVCILNSYSYFQYDNNEETVSHIESANEAIEFAKSKFETQPIVIDNPNIDNYRNLDKFEKVYLLTHGNTYKIIDFNNVSSSYCCLALPLSAIDLESWESIIDMIKSNQIVVLDNFIFITYLFFDMTYDDYDFANTEFYVISCKSMGECKHKDDENQIYTPVNNLKEYNPNKYDYLLANTFISKSAKLYIGMYNTVYVYYASRFLTDFIVNYIEGDTILDSYTHSIDKNGFVDYDFEQYNFEELDLTLRENNHFHDPATPVVVTRNYICVVDFSKSPRAVTIISNDKEGLKNRTVFEPVRNKSLEESQPGTSDINSWKTEGDVRVQWKMGEVEPPDGSAFAIVGTGIGDGISNMDLLYHSAVLIDDVEIM